MIRNSMPLRKLVAFIILAITFFTGCISYGMTYEIRGRVGASLYVLYGFGVVSFLLVSIAVGLWQKQNWARVLLIGILVLSIFGWSVLAVFWFHSLNTFSGGVEKYLPFVFSGFLVPILLAGIFLLSHSKFKEEFEEEN
ncbi:MAG: hypothetical protein AAF573_15030 [Bacteroidota bacterium]